VKAKAAKARAKVAKVKAAVAQKKGAVKAKAAKVKAAVAQKKGAVRARAAKAKAAVVQKKAGKKAKKAAKAVKVAAVKATVAQKKAAVKAKAAKIKSSGAVSPYSLFVQKQGINAVKAAVKWNKLSAKEKAPLVAEATKNLAKRDAIRATFKKPAGKYALFVKKNFAAAYAAALKKSSDKKVAFKAASQAVAKKYKSQ